MLSKTGSHSQMKNTPTNATWIIRPKAVPYISFKLMGGRIGIDEAVGAEGCDEELVAVGVGWGISGLTPAGTSRVLVSTLTSTGAFIQPGSVDLFCTRSCNAGTSEGEPKQARIRASVIDPTSPLMAFSLLKRGDDRGLRKSALLKIRLSS